MITAQQLIALFLLPANQNDLDAFKFNLNKGKFNPASKPPAPQVTMIFFGEYA